MSFFAQGISTSEIEVFSNAIGGFPYSLYDKDSLSVVKSGTLTFTAPFETTGFGFGLYRTVITGLTAGTKFELTVDGNVIPNLETWYAITKKRQVLFPSEATPRLTPTGINTYGNPEVLEMCELNGKINDFGGGTNNRLPNGPRCIKCPAGQTLEINISGFAGIGLANNIVAGNGTPSLDLTPGSEKVTFTPNQVTWDVRVRDAVNNDLIIFTCEEGQGVTVWNKLGLNETYTLNYSNGAGNIAQVHQEDDTVAGSYADSEGGRFDGALFVPLFNATTACNNSTDVLTGQVAYPAQAKDQPCAQVANNAILTFSNLTPNTRPSVVTIGAGTATGSYNSGTGVFTIGASGTGTVEYFTVTAGGETFDVYLCAGTGLGQVWKRGSIQIEIAFPGSTSWTTTNVNAVLQNKGGRKAENMEVGTLALTTPVNFGTGGFKIEWEGIPYSMFLPTDPDSKRVYLLIGSSFSSDIIFVNRGQITIAQGGFSHNVVFSAPTSSGLLPNQLNTLSVEKDTVNSRWRVIVNGQETDIPAASSSGTFAQSYELDFLNVLGLGDGNYDTINRFSVYNSAGVEIHRWTPVSSLIDTIGGNNITSNLQRTGYIISALDASDNPTGSDVTGFNLTRKGFLDVGTIQRNPYRSPALNPIIDPDIDETWSAVEPPNVPNQKFAVITVTDQVKEEVSAYYEGTGSEEAQILKLLANATHPAPSIVLAPATYKIKVVDELTDPIQGAQIVIGSGYYTTDINGEALVFAIEGTANITKDGFANKTELYSFRGIEAETITITLLAQSCINPNPLNDFNFIRWHRLSFDLPFVDPVEFCDTLTPEIANPFIQIKGKCFTPIVSPNEGFKFFANIEGGILDTDFANWRLAIFDLRTKTIVSDDIAPIQRILLNADPGNYQFYINEIQFPVVDDGIYYLLIYNSVDSITKFISTPFRVVNSNPDQISTKIRYSHDRDLYGFPYSLLNIENEIRIQLFQEPKSSPFEGNVTQYKAITTGKVRITRNAPDKLIDFRGYKLDDKAHEALFTALLHRETYFNNKRYVVADGASYELIDPTRLSPLSDSKFSAYEYDFSSVNK